MLPDNTAAHPGRCQFLWSLPWKPQISFDITFLYSFRYSSHAVQCYIFLFPNRPGGREGGVGTSDSDTVITGVKDILSMNCHIPYSNRVPSTFRISRENRASRCSSRRTRDHELSYKLREAGLRVLVEHPRFVEELKTNLLSFVIFISLIICSTCFGH